MLEILKDAGAWDMLKIKTNYGPEQAILETDRATLRIGSKAGEFAAYDLLLGALSACFHSTLHDILEKEKWKFQP